MPDVCEGRVLFPAPVSFRFDDDGLAVSGAHGSTMTRYEDIISWEEKDSTFVLQVPGGTVVVPWSAFTPGGLDGVRSKLRAYVVQRGLPLRARLRTLAVWVTLVVGFLAVWHLLGR